VWALGTDIRSGPGLSDRGGHGLDGRQFRFWADGVVCGIFDGCDDDWRLRRRADGVTSWGALDDPIADGALFDGLSDGLSDGLLARRIYFACWFYHLARDRLHDSARWIHRSHGVARRRPLDGRRLGLVLSAAAADGGPDEKGAGDVVRCSCLVIHPHSRILGQHS
jgi:hypothetical protein